MTLPGLIFDNSGDFPWEAALLSLFTILAFVGIHRFFPDKKWNAYETIKFKSRFQTWFKYVAIALFIAIMSYSLYPSESSRLVLTMVYASTWLLMAWKSKWSVLQITDQGIICTNDQVVKIETRRITDFEIYHDQVVIHSKKFRNHLILNKKSIQEEDWTTITALLERIVAQEDHIELNKNTPTTAGA